MSQSGTPLRHTLLEDAHALIMGCLFIFCGLAFLQTAGQTTGGIAGLALLAHLMTGLPAPLLFFMFNVPFYYFSYVTMGREFVVKTAIVNFILLAAGYATPLAFRELQIDPVFASLGGGTLLGMGVLALARHNASVGGFTSVALFVQKRRGIPAGYVQAATDGTILAMSIFAMPFSNFALSVLSVAALSVVLVMNHKPGRYMGY